MLATDPKKRISLSEIRAHPWILKLHRNPPDSFVPAFKPVLQIDECIMREVVAVGFDDNPSNRHAILKNKSKQVVSAYHLFLTRREKTLQQLHSLSNNNKPSLAGSKLKIASGNNVVGQDEGKKQPLSLKEAPTKDWTTDIPPTAPQPSLKRSFSNEEIVSDTVIRDNRRHLKNSQKKNRLV